MQFRWPIRSAKSPAAGTPGIVGSGESLLLCLRDPAVARRRSIRWRPCGMNETNIEHPTSNAEHRRQGGAAVRMKAPNPKIQIPKKLQIQSSNMAVARRCFAAWDFSGAWCLGFGSEERRVDLHLRRRRRVSSPGLAGSACRSDGGAAI